MVEPAHRLLVADQDETLRADTAALLRQAGYAVAEAGDTGAVLPALDGPRLPELVLLDLSPPTARGLEALRLTAERAPGTGFIVWTAYGSSALALQTIQLGAFDYLTKPLDRDELLTAVARYFEHRALRDRRSDREH